MSQSRDRRLHPPERCNRNAHTTRTAQVVHQKLRAGKTSRRAHNRQKREESGHHHGGQIAQNIP